jgi:hypothetical protein
MRRLQVFLQGGSHNEVVISLKIKISTLKEAEKKTKSLNNLY